jgi:hypothetical protein
MATTPQITLTANLESIMGGVAAAGYLRVTLCGYGQVAPAVPGTAMLADAGVPQLTGPQAGTTPISVTLFGNDVIVPAATFYDIAVLDAHKNVIQTGNYQFNGSGAFDLSTLQPITAPYGFPLLSLEYRPCAGSGTTYNAPGQPVLAVTYNGILMRPNLPAPFNSYTVSGAVITLTFTADPLDRIDAFCIL